MKRTGRSMAWSIKLQVCLWQRQLLGWCSSRCCNPARPPSGSKWDSLVSLINPSMMQHFIVSEGLPQVFHAWTGQAVGMAVLRVEGGHVL